MLQKYKFPSRQMVTRQSRRQRYLNGFAELREVQQREHQLVLMLLITEALSKLARRHEALGVSVSVSVQQRL
jgi:hypothetical protein